MSLDRLESLLARPQAEVNSRPANLRWLGAFGLPFGLVGGFCLLFALLFGERLLPARKVTVDTVVTLASDPAAPSSTVTSTSDKPSEAAELFQASGWLEPDPFPIRVTALVSGVVDEVFVLEGQNVTRNQVIATLIDEDARLDLATAKASQKANDALLQAKAAAIEVGQAKLATARERLRSGQALGDYLVTAADRYQAVGQDTVPALTIQDARQRALAQNAEVAALRSEVAEAMAHLDLLRQEQAVAEADLALSDTEVARRELALRRTRITAPMDGRIMRLFVHPGQQRALGAENPQSAAVAYLYDPTSLQARIDVPLSEAAQLQVGQPVRLRTNFLPDEVFPGKVTRIAGEADLQRNTLQVKVTLLSPDDRLRPDMLCRVAFLAAPVSSALPKDTLQQIRLFVPETALVRQSGTTAEVWVLDGPQRNRLRKQTVSLGPTQRDSYWQIQDGLQPGERVVINPASDLVEGERVRALEPSAPPSQP